MMTGNLNSNHLRLGRLLLEASGKQNCSFWLQPNGPLLSGLTASQIPAMCRLSWRPGTQNRCLQLHRLKSDLAPPGVDGPASAWQGYHSHQT